MLAAPRRGHRDLVPRPSGSGDRRRAPGRDATRFQAEARDADMGPTQRGQLRRPAARRTRTVNGAGRVVGRGASVTTAEGSGARTGHESVEARALNDEMTVGELMGLLEDQPEDAVVRIVHQQSWPLQEVVG